MAKKRMQRRFMAGIAVRVRRMGLCCGIIKEERQALMENSQMIIIIVMLLLQIILIGAVIFMYFSFRKELDDTKEASGEAVRDAMTSYNDMIWRSLRETSDRQAERLGEADRHQGERLSELDKKINLLSITTEQRLDAMRDAAVRQNESIEAQIEEFRKQNDEQLEKMRETVDEKLQSTLERRISQSFRLVSDNLEQVSKGLGEMQTLARGVGDLKKVLTNVKTRGNLGEIQLGAILDEILAPGQYERNVNTKGFGRETVEFAVKLPGENGRRVWLPIDSKFPGDSYIRLVDAYDKGDAQAIDAARKNLVTVVRQEAKDIREKYIAPPETTDFGIMFLPSEGLYAEVVRLGMVEVLQHEYRVTIAGPTTMAALLNSLQMGFRTLAIEKRTSEVWETLSAVKTEFTKFEDVLKKAQENLTKANSNLDELIGARTRVMQRKLRDVTEMDSAEAIKLLGTEDDTE